MKINNKIKEIEKENFELKKLSAIKIKKVAKKHKETKDMLKDVIGNILKKGEEDLSEPVMYFWDSYYEKDKEIDAYDLYKFSDCLELMKHQGRKVIEAKEGHVCVVEKTKDKYLLKECDKLLNLIKQSIQKQFQKEIKELQGELKKERPMKLSLNKFVDMKFKKRFGEINKKNNLKGKQNTLHTSKNIMSNYLGDVNKGHKNNIYKVKKSVESVTNSKEKKDKDLPSNLIKQNEK